jgi:hypothetical protein
MKYLVALSGVLIWLSGIVVATGFWSTTFTIVIPPYAWYLSVEHFMRLLGWL